MFENREAWLTALVSEIRPAFEAIGFPLPALIRVTCGFPSRHARSLNRAIGEHWSPSASSDGTHEILISPVEDDPVKVAAILFHELSHAACGNTHRGDFVAAVRMLHLEGKPTSTFAGQKFHDEWSALIDSLGPYPHAALRVGADRKVQSTRMLKACCPQCGYTIRLTAKWQALGLPICPVDGNQFV